MCKHPARFKTHDDLRRKPHIPIFEDRPLPQNVDDYTDDDPESFLELKWFNTENIPHHIVKRQLMTNGMLATNARGSQD